MSTTTLATYVLAGTLVGLAFGCERSSKHDAPAESHQAGHKMPSHDPTIHKETERTLGSEHGAYRVTYAPTPDVIPTNELFTLRLEIQKTTPEGVAAPLPEGAVVETDAAMPHHKHGMNVTPRVTRAEDGSFLVEGMLFHMGGYWEIYVDVVLDESKERTTFGVILK